MGHVATTKARHFVVGAPEQPFHYVEGAYSGSSRQGIGTRATAVCTPQGQCRVTQTLVRGRQTWSRTVVDSRQRAPDNSNCGRGVR
jgi:hypothetical protein